MLARGRPTIQEPPFNSHACLQDTGDEIGECIDSEDGYNSEETEENASRSKSDQTACAPDELIDRRDPSILAFGDDVRNQR